MNQSKWNAIDLFAGCGGLTEGLKQAGFKVVAAIELDKHAIETYEMNHSNTLLFGDDIRNLDTERIKKLLKGQPLHLLAGCPPCQGFSRLRRLNRKHAIRDRRNNLLDEYYRFVKDLNPVTIMLENVPGIINYSLFKNILCKFRKLGYCLSYKIVDVANYSVPQRRKRLVLIGSKAGQIEIALGNNKIITVKKAFNKLKGINKKDLLHKIYPKHTFSIKQMISLIPKNGGSRKDLPKRYQLQCHNNTNIGFNDIYGRLNWESVSSTITGGCLSPSKGRFLHPQKNRCISAREAAILQTFPVNYKFPNNIPRNSLALLIGNALPPKFSKIQATNILHHIQNSSNDINKPFIDVGKS